MRVTEIIGQTLKIRIDGINSWIANHHGTTVSVDTRHWISYNDIVMISFGERTDWEMGFLFESHPALGRREVDRINAMFLLLHLGLITSNECGAKKSANRSCSANRFVKLPPIAIVLYCVHCAKSVCQNEIARPWAGCRPLTSSDFFLSKIERRFSTNNHCRPVSQHSFSRWQ